MKRPDPARFVLAVVAIWTAAGACILSPQPDPPGANIVASATDGPGSVVVVGGEETVPPGAGVRVSNDADDAFASAEASSDGTFIAVLSARPGEVVRVTYTIFENGEWRESLPRRIIVDQYDPALPPMAGARDDISPWAPGEYDAAGTFDTAMYVDSPIDGRARVWCVDGGLESGVRLIIANQDTGDVIEVSYISGPFEVRMRASIGDVLLVFAVRESNELQTSRVVQLVVPAP